METIDSILRYWFGDSPGDADVIREMSPLWWKKNPGVDTDIRQRFSATLAAESEDKLESWSTNPRGQLARIILCDQFPRNMFRGKPESFQYDARARHLARTALDQGMDRRLRPVERVFVYLPFEHSENGRDQETSVRLFTTLLDEAAPALNQPFRNFLDFATRHKEIIDRFGRFPHRNALLGRASTPEELEFLKGPGSSF
ncbi:MAG: DUF924 domain-containing protein [Gammaproteobacteria bacterium]|nr:DUF924 domain-containing protein [Gammaproteobacteria bacterium]MDH5513321.1 DUF924 domain-containing protein [Gammaproteobacteria bacterium]